MTKKTTRRALITSVISMLLCVTMLVGTTFAWFTDSVKSGKNRIVAGNLDVELEYLKDGTWETVNGETNVFKEGTLWEPGHTEVVYLKVKNAGTLALKYDLGVNVASEVLSVNVKGELLKLSDYIMVGVVDGRNTAFATRDEARAAFNANDAKAINAGYAKNGSLEAKGEDYVALVVYMPETVGNEANYKTGAEIPEILLGIDLYATQLASEEDSFDKYYDGASVWYGGIDTSWYNANATEFTIGTAEELAGLAAIVNGTAKSSVSLLTTGSTASTIQDSFSGKTIKLVSDINLNNRLWTPIGNWDNAFEGDFDGNDHTIYNLYINDTTEETGEGVGLIGVAQNSFIKNINVHNVDITGYSMAATIAGSPYTGCTVSGCHVTGSVSLVVDWAYVGGIVGYGYTKVENCSVIAEGTGKIISKTRNAVGGIAAWLLEDASSIKNCQVKNLDMTGWANIGAITGFMHRLGVIDNCSAENVTMTKTRGDGIATIGLASGGWNYNASKAITITNNTFKNITLNGTYVANAGADILYGGEYYGEETTNFILDNNTQENITNNLVEVKVIKNAAELETAFTNGGTYTLANDVDVEGKTITVPAGKTVVLYMNGKTIAGTNSATATHNDLFLVKGNLTVNGGKITLAHAAANMAWNGATSVFDITAGGVLNVNGTYIENLGGTDMNFAVHMNNWGEVTLNADDAYFKATYIPVRVFNSGPDMNNVTIKNSTLDGGNYSFWVHNYASSDFGGKLYSGSSAAYDEAKVAERLNFDIFGNGNIFITGKPAPVRYGFNSSIFFSDIGKEVVTTLEGLQSAIDNATGTVIITLASDITGDIIVPQKDGVKITIDGDGHIIAGTITVDGKSARYANAALTVKNVNFKANSISYDACIRLGGNNAMRYTNNVTVSGCTFDVPGAVAVKSYTGGDWNLTIENCTVSANCHSLAQVTNVEKGLTITGCKVYSKNGANLNNTPALEMSGCEFDVKGYAVRFGVSGNTVNGTFSIANSTLKAACNDGDSVIVLRGTMTGSTLTLTNTTLVGSSEISGSANIVHN